jgi:KUP system potassium uptake protein
VIARFGFMERPDVPAALARAREKGLRCRDEDVTFYLAHLTLLATDRIGMSAWRENLFIFLSRNARRVSLRQEMMSPYFDFTTGSLSD